MEKMSCPYCGQGLLYRIIIRRIGLESYLCDECDTVWYKYEDVSVDTGIFVEDIFRWIGAKPEDYQKEIEFYEAHPWPVR